MQKRKSSEEPVFLQYTVFLAVKVVNVRLFILFFLFSFYFILSFFFFLFILNLGKEV